MLVKKKSGSLAVEKSKSRRKWRRDDREVPLQPLPDQGRDQCARTSDLR